jgi:type IV pilus assembly protein PilQ
MDQQAAVVSQGVQIPYTTTSENGTASTTFQQADLKLEVTPQITPDGTLVLTLDVSKDSLGQLTTSGYAINTNRVKTQALVENGGTVVIGGVYELDESNSENKVPFFGDLPIVGNLFKNKAKRIKKNELLVFITPKIVMDKNSTSP